MARKRKKSSMGNLDSLLDTMTSVVGILIIILIVIQLGVKEKVKELLDIVNEEISVKDLEKKERDIKTLEDLIKKKEQDFISKNKAHLTAMNKLSLAKNEITKTKQQLNLIQNVKANPVNITKDINLALKEIKAKEKELESIELEEAKLKKLLATAKRIKSKPDKTVKLPNPRPAPPGSRGVYFICNGGRVFYRNDDEYREYFKKKVEDSRAKKNKDDEYDPAYLKKYFSTRSNITPFGKFEFYNNKTNIYFRLKFGRSVGELSSFIARTSSRYQRELSKLDNKKYYIVFQVQPDSYSTYLTARAVAEKLGFACGWQPQGKNEWDYNLWTPMRVIGAKKIIEARKDNPPATKPSNVLD
ncbi:MAG: hypothetical protein NE328_05800 [Lentisphaeraceae bacterium]|nr:hypothetical protein [Lentisphaeraceae bacterium]